MTFVKTSTALMKAAIAVCHKAAFDIRFAIRSRRWRAAETMAMPSHPVFLVTGFLSEPLGIGRAGRLTVSALRALTPHVAQEDLRPFFRRLLTRRPQPFDMAQRPSVWLIHANPPEARIALYARHHAEWCDTYRIGYWVWETSVAPLSWAAAAKWFHEIWVPSRFVFDALSQAFALADTPAYQGKLRIMPHPVLPVSKPSPHAAGALAALIQFDPRSDFERKNPLAAIAAWIEAFPAPTRNLRLVVKSHEGADSYPQYQTLVNMASGRTDIDFIRSTLSHDEADVLLAGCDIIISLHRGEGFGLALAEAMAAGRCVVATGWSGNLEFMTPDNSMLVPATLTPANSTYNGPLAHWAEPDWRAAAAAIRTLASDPSLRRRLGTQARRDIETLSVPWKRWWTHDDPAGGRISKA